jgi:hypothetical protein
MGDSTRSWPLWQRLLWVLAAGLVGCWQGPSFVKDLRPEPNHPLDFFQEWASARNHFAGLPVYLPQRESLRIHCSLEPPPHFLEYNAHPPTSVLLTLPLGKLDYANAFLVWNLMCLASFAVALGLVVRGLQVRWSWWAVFPLVVLLLLCEPFRHQVIQGQLSMFLAFLLTAAWFAHRRGADSWAGFWLGLATAVKLFPAFLLAYALWRGRFRTVLVGTATVLLLTALTVGVLGTDCYRDYARDVLPTLQRFQFNGDNISLVGFGGKLFAPNNSWDRDTILSREEQETATHELLPWDRLFPLQRNQLLARMVSAFGIVAVGLALAWTTRPWRGEPGPDLGFSLALTAMLLVSPITWNHYFLLLLVPLAVLWVRLPRRTFVRLVFWAAVIGLWLNLTVVFYHTVPGGTSNGFARPVHILTTLSFQTYALFAIFVLLLCEARRVQPT